MGEGRKIRIRRYDSPCGLLTLGAFDGRLCLCDWLVEGRSERVNRGLLRRMNAEFAEAPSKVTDRAAEQLDRYFAGERPVFDLPLLFVGTDFQRRVWEELRRIPYGETISYGELARRIGMPRAVRAVANANGANPMSIFVPCHRVIGSDRSLTGYGGGLPAKRYLLALEADAISLETRSVICAGK